MGPKYVDKEERRKQIFQAAMALFAQKGVYRTTIQEIADQAGIGKGTIYEYFNSKEEILSTSFQYMQEEAEAFLENELYRDENDPVQLLSSFFTSFIKYFESIPENVTEILMVYWAEAILEAPGTNPDDVYTGIDFRSMYDQYIKMLDEILVNGQQKNVFRPDLKTKQMASAIVGTIDGLMLQQVLFKDRVDFRAVVQELLNSILNGILQDSDQ